MNMIAHQAPSQQSHLCIAQISSQQLQVCVPVFLCRESHALIHTTLRNVMSPRHASREAHLLARIEIVAAFWHSILGRLNNPWLIIWINLRSSGCPPFPQRIFSTWDRH